VPPSRVRARETRYCVLTIGPHKRAAVVAQWGAVGFIVWLDVAVSGVNGVKTRFGIVVQVTQLSL
jgi:nitrate reductase NapE component